MTRTSFAPLSLLMVCLVHLLTIALTIVLYWRLYTTFTDETRKGWIIIMILLNLPMIIGAVLIMLQRRAGVWWVLAGKMLFFMIPAVAGRIDSIMGLLTPVFMLETLLILGLYSTRLKYLR